MKALGRVVVAVLAATLLNSLAIQTIPFTAALLSFLNIAYFHHVVHYGYHTEATIEYMMKYLEEFHCQKDVFSWFCTSKSTKMVSEALKEQLSFDKQEERESDPAWNNLSAAAKRCFVEDDKMQIESAHAQHLINKLYFHFVMMHLLKHILDHIHQLGNVIHAAFELPACAKMGHRQGYRQLNRHVATFQILRSTAWNEVFQHLELNADTAKQPRNDAMPLTEALINRMM